jgi:hypothetical protein
MLKTSLLLHSHSRLKLRTITEFDVSSYMVPALDAASTSMHACACKNSVCMSESLLCHTRVTNSILQALYALGCPMLAINCFSRETCTAAAPSRLTVCDGFVR